MSYITPGGNVSPAIFTLLADYKDNSTKSITPKTNINSWFLVGCAILVVIILVKGS